MSLKFDWDKDNLQHATRHGISAQEAEECFDNEHLLFPKPHSLQRHGEKRFYLLGRTHGGKRVFMVFKRMAKSCVRVISVRRMTPGEESKYEV